MSRVFYVEYAGVLLRLSTVPSCGLWHGNIINLECTMNLETRIVALERSLNHQRKIITGLLCVLFAGLGIGATSAAKESVEITNGGFGRPLKVVLVNGTSSGSPHYKVE